MSIVLNIEQEQRLIPPAFGAGASELPRGRAKQKAPFSGALRFLSHMDLRFCLSLGSASAADY
jgi:hypothetical protein